MPETIAIVGANVAGGNAAHHLRKLGYDGRLVLIGAEAHLPYERPPLSKGVLLGTVEPQVVEIWPEAAYAAADIEVELGVRVDALDAATRRLHLHDGRSITVDDVLLCTGARPRRLDLPGIERGGVHDLRTVDDAVRLRDELEPGTNVVIVGAGFIGAEVAAAAVQRGCRVVMLEVAPLPLQRVLGPEVGTLYAAMHRDRGVDVQLGVQIDAIEGDRRCRAVRLADGRVIPADIVVCGVGVVPRTELAEGAGATVANGIVVDERCRTSVEHVFACGDVAARPSSYRAGPVRLESWQNAQNQALAAARCMLGSDIPFDDVPWFWSDQYDVNLQVAGFPDPTDEIVWRGDPEAPPCTAFYLHDGVVTAAVGLNRARDVRVAMNLIRDHARADATVLADPSVDLREVRYQPTAD